MILGKGRLSHLDVIVIKTTTWAVEWSISWEGHILEDWQNDIDKEMNKSFWQMDECIGDGFWCPATCCRGAVPIALSDFSWMRSQLRFCDSFQLFLIKERYYILMTGISLLFTGTCILFVWPYHREDLSPHQATCTHATTVDKTYTIIAISHQSFISQR